MEPLLRLESAHDAARTAGGASGGGDQVPLHSELLHGQSCVRTDDQRTPRSVHGPTVHPLAQQRCRLGCILHGWFFLGWLVASSFVRVTQEHHEVVGKAKNLKRLRPLLVASFGRDLDAEVSSV